MVKDIVSFYFTRIEFYMNLRKGKGISQTDMAKAQKDVKEYMKGTK